ncbi:MAG: hypothetical protein AB1498_06470 [bacterium]
MVKKSWYCIITVFFMILSVITAAVGCKGGETKKAANEVIDEFTGNRAVKQGRQMKNNIEDIKKESIDREENFKKQMGNE